MVSHVLAHCFVFVCVVAKGDTEEGVAVSLAVPSTSPPTHGSPTGMIKEAATPPSSPSMGSVLTVQGWV